MRVNYLCPGELMTVKVEVNGRELVALIDSGASNTLIKSCFVGEGRSKYPDRSMKGIGGNPVKIVDEKCLEVKMFGMSFEWKMLVVNDDIGYDIILGYDFMKANKFKVNMKRRILSVVRPDEAIVKFYLNSKFQLDKIMVERVPVYCKENVKVKLNTLTKVPVEYECLRTESGESNQIMFYEGVNNQVESVDGVMANDGEGFVFVEKVSKRRCIKKGQILGYVCSMMESGEEEDLTEPNDEWSESKIEKEVKLGDQLSEGQKQEVRLLLHKVKEALSKGDHDIGTASVEPHRMEVNQRTPIWQKPRNFSQPVNEEVERQCSELFASDILEYSDSGWSSPIVPVRKADGSLRLCVDYRMVNKVTKKEEYPMPNLTKCIYKPNMVKFFTKLDLVRGYYQVPIDKDSRKYTAFSTMQHHYQFKRLSFGLRNSAQAFQKIMQQILAPVLNHNVIIYIDDILIMSETFEQHMEIVSKVLQLLMKYRIKVKVNKCEWFQKQVVFLGHVINEDGIKKSPEYVEKVLKVERPETVKQMRKFLGLVNFQRKFVKDCSVLMKPLSEWMNGKGTRKIAWNDEMVRAFDRLKEEIARDVLLTYPDYRKEAIKMELYVDASCSGCGSCLMQKKNGRYEVIAYGSMSFSDTQKRYSTTDREITAIRWAVNNFRSFLSGVPFILLTDHKPLTYLNSMSSSNSRLMRTVEELAEFDFEIRYRPGKDNEAADFLSRVNGPDSREIEQMEADDHKYLPKELKKICEVPGGGDSLYESLYVAMKEGHDAGEYKRELPGDYRELREILVDELSRNGKEYGIGNGKQIQRRLKVMKKPGQQPISEVMLAASKIYAVKLLVYYGMKSPVVFVYDDAEDKYTIRLQCVSMIHFNPLYERKRLEGEEVKDKYVNMAITNEVSVNKTIMTDDMLEEGMLEESQEIDLICGHSLYHTSANLDGFPEGSACCIFDTGAQISLVSESVIKKLEENGETLTIEKTSSRLVGLNQERQDVKGYVNLEVSIKGVKCQVLPFAIVEASLIPTCFLFGANFIMSNEIEIDFQRDQVAFTNLEPQESYAINNVFGFSQTMFRLVGDICYGLTLQETASSSSTDSDEESGELTQTDDETNVNTEEGKEEEIVPKYVISNDKLINMQTGNYAIRRLRQQIGNKIPVSAWKFKDLNQFKRSSKQLRFVGQLMVRGEGKDAPVVVALPFMIELIDKTHKSLNHVGGFKLVRAIQPYFWHPGMDGLCREYCRSCSHCQKYKNHRIDRVPPIVKIQTKRPFELVCVDLLKYTRSKRGNEYMLVCIDHYSKWLCIQPIKDKKAQTVATALREKILPTLPKVPERLLSDNGQEFVGKVTEGVLEEFNIVHSKSSAYFAPGNGITERVNRTIIQMLKDNQDVNWDEKLHKVIINYNNSVHTETKMTPSQMILTMPHLTKPRFPVRTDIVMNWKEGNPNFCPFKIGQKVLRKVVRIGTLLIDKQKERYEGPFIVRKVQSNGMSYEIEEEGNENRVLKVNHRQIRRWYEVPKHIARYLKEESKVEIDESEGEVSYNDTSSSNDERRSIMSDTETTSDFKLDEISRTGRGSVSRSDTSKDSGSSEENEVESSPRDAESSSDHSSESHGRLKNQAIKHTEGRRIIEEENNEPSTDMVSIEKAALEKLTKEASENGRKAKVMEQWLMVFNELVQKWMDETMINMSDFKDASFLSSVTEFELTPDGMPVHSTPKRDGRATIRGNEGEVEVTDCLPLQEIEQTGVGTAPTEDDFSGFRDDGSGPLKNIQHILQVIDKIQKVCHQDGSASTAQRFMRGEYPDVTNIIREAEDTVSELPSPNSRVRYLRRSTRQRQPIDRFVAGAKK